MTLILTLIRPGEGVWQTVDARLTRGGKLEDNFASKQISVHRQDGTMLLAYTGLAEVHPSGESMFDWIRSTLRGNARSVEGDMLHLRERLNRDVARAPRRYSEIPLILTAAAVLGTRPDLSKPMQNRRMARWVLTNLTWPDGVTSEPKVVPSFQLEGSWVDEPWAWALGSVRNIVLESDTQAARLRRAASHRPKKPLDYLGLLAAVNRWVAPHSKGTVSPWCSGTFMPEIGQGLTVRLFRENGDPEPPEPAGLPTIMFGLDTTDIMRRQQLALRNQKLGLAPPPPFDDSSSLNPRP